MAKTSAITATVSPALPKGSRGRLPKRLRSNESIEISSPCPVSPSACRFPCGPLWRTRLLVPVASYSDGGKTVNKDLFNVKDDVFVEKRVVLRSFESPAKHGLCNRNRGGRRRALPVLELGAIGAIREQLVDRDERPVGGGCGRFDRFAAAREAVDDGHYGDGLKTLLFDLLDRLYGRAAGGDGVLDDEHLVALPHRALDPALEAVLLALAADEEADKIFTRKHGQRRAGGRDRRGRWATDRGRAGLDRGRGDQLAGSSKPRRPQQRPAGIDVVLRRRPTGQRHLAKDQRVFAQLGDQRALGEIEVRHVRRRRSARRSATVRRSAAGRR